LPQTKVLIIDDEIEVGTFFRRLLQKNGYDVKVAVNGAEAARLINETSFSVAMVDLKLPDADGLSLLQQIKNLQPSCEVIIMTGYSTTRTAVKAIQLGAFDYLEKPFEDIDEVEKLIKKASEYGLRGCDGPPANEEWHAVAERLGFKVGISQAMHRLVSVAYKIAKKNINVLLHGETGTGKEVLARFIHAASSRSDQVFIPVNCGALPENLLESELFGHEKGSFTGAGSLRRGIFELANRGTLFLDEIGESSLAIQVKLLRVLETGEFLRVGGEKPIKTDVRVIAATNTDLEQSMKDKTFREDLFYRLDVVRLELPPLRERREDIPLLAEYFIKKLNPDIRISTDAIRLLCNYQWPGNIRELANTISQAAALCDGKIILPGHLSGKFRSSGPDPPAAPAAGTPLPGGGDGTERACPVNAPERLLERLLDDERWLEAAGGQDLSSLLKSLRKLESRIVEKMREKGVRVETEPPPPMEKIEARAIAEALSYYGGNISLAAKRLGMGRNTLYRKLRDYNLR